MTVSVRDIEHNPLAHRSVVSFVFKHRLPGRRTDAFKVYNYDRKWYTTHHDPMSVVRDDYDRWVEELNRWDEFAARQARSDSDTGSKDGVL